MDDDVLAHSFQKEWEEDASGRPGAGAACPDLELPKPYRLAPDSKQDSDASMTSASTVSEAGAEQFAGHPLSIKFSKHLVSSESPSSLRPCAPRRTPESELPSPCAEEEENRESEEGDAAVNVEVMAGEAADTGGRVSVGMTRLSTLSAATTAQNGDDLLSPRQSITWMRQLSFMSPKSPISDDTAVHADDREDEVISKSQHIQIIQ
ncbi:hypothetical protein HK101_001028, partial [Irineochytrium annulatum]